jgi:glutamyl-tRNA synthetase
MIWLEKAWPIETQRACCAEPSRSNRPAWISRRSAEDAFRALAEELNLKPGQLFGILRVAVTGKTVSPPLFESMAVIGKETVLKRLQEAVNILEKTSE